jgi:hypothetical protein
MPNVHDNDTTNSISDAAGGFRSCARGWTKKPMIVLGNMCEAEVCMSDDAYFSLLRQHIAAKGVGTWENFCESQDGRIQQRSTSPSCSTTLQEKKPTHQSLTTFVKKHIINKIYASISQTARSPSSGTSPVVRFVRSQIKLLFFSTASAPQRNEAGAFFDTS